MSKKNTKAIEIKLKSYSQTSLFFYVDILKTTLVDFGYSVSIVNLPVKFKRLTLLRSPHVYKKAKEQFESRVYSTFIQISNTKDDNLFKLSRLKFLLLNKSKSILVKTKLLQ